MPQPSKKKLAVENYEIAGESFRRLVLEGSVYDPMFVDRTIYDDAKKLGRFVRDRDAHLRVLYGVIRARRAYYAPAHVLDAYSLVYDLLSGERDELWNTARRADPQGVISSHAIPSSKLREDHPAVASRLAHSRGPSVVLALESAYALGSIEAVVAMLDRSYAP